MVPEKKQTQKIHHRIDETALQTLTFLSPTCPKSYGLPFFSPALDGGKMFLGRLRVQTSKDFIQALGFVDNLTGRGKG